jgi:hypothetical protein
MAMGRILIPRDADLSLSFKMGINVLSEAGFQIRSGTKLLTRYAVLVVDDDALDGAIERLAAAGIKAQKDIS